jgi:hypothetical protein
MWNPTYPKAASAFAVLVLLQLGGSSLLAQQQSTSDQIQQLTDQKTILQLQSDIAALQKAAAAVQSSSSSVNDQLTDQKSTLQLQSDIQSLQNGMTTSQINTLKAQIGSINTSNLPQGNVSMTNVDLQPTIIGYAGLRSAMDKVYKKLYSTCPTTKVIFGSTQFADVAAYQAYMKLLDQASDALVPYTDAPDFTKVSVGFAPAIAFAAVDAAVSLGQLFKSDVTINGTSLSPDGQAAQAILANKLITNCAAKPSVVILNLANVNGMVADQSDLLKLLESVNDDLASAVNASTSVQANSIATLQQTITNIQKKLSSYDDLEASKQAAQKALAKATGADQQKLKDQIASLQSQESDLNQPQAIKDLASAKAGLLKANAFVAQVAVLSTRITALTAVLNKIDDTGIPFMVRLLHAERMKSLIGSDPVLSLNVIKLGGNSIVKKNAFRTTVSYAGGAIVQYELRSTDGISVLAAGQEDSFVYHKEKDLLGSPE